MKVYYSSSIWNNKKGRSGLPQKVGWQFEYEETKRCIPVIYRFPEGIVFDIITILDEAKIRDFTKKYKTIERTLTPLQQRCAEQEHPYQPINTKDIWINGKQVSGGNSYSSTMSIPWMYQNDELEQVRRAYSSVLKDTVCFACQRLCVPYPETGSKIQRLLRSLRINRVNKIELSTYPVQHFLPLDIHLEISNNESQKEIHFNHPVTGNKHTLYFQNIETTEFPIGQDNKCKLYTASSMYEIEPALPQGNTLQFNSSIQYTEIPEDKFSPTAASSIGIIGGADGPTATFISSKKEEKNVPCGLHGLPLQCCFSVPSLKKEDTFKIFIEGISTIVSESKTFSIK